MTSTPVHFHETYKNCLNCGAQVSNSYCSVCGQETRLHVPSAGEFIHEFVGHYVALEGRLWKTLRCLLFKPGFLTAEYIAGRRKRYVEPLRVYLTFSIIFFALLKLGGPPVVTLDESSAPSRTGTRAVVQQRVTPPASAATPAPGKRQKADGSARFEDMVRQYFPSMAERVEAFENKPAAERAQLVTKGFFAYVPYAMFLLMPLFALYLKLLYLGSGRRYGEHLLFALHTNAFAFAAMSLTVFTIAMDWGFLTFVIGL